MSGGITVTLARRMIQDAPWAQARLRAYAGHTVSWDFAGVRGAVLLDADGLPGPLPAMPGSVADASPPASAAATPAAGDSARAAAARRSVRLVLAADDLGALGQGFDALMRCVSIEGNAGLASEIAFIARHLRPEPEEWLAPWLGDALAERTGSTLRAALSWGLAAGQRAARVGTEYVVHEAALLAAPEAVAAHCAEVDELREAADRLAQRLAWLERSR